MSGRLKMAVFDLDGTLVDSLAHIARAMATAFTAADLAPPPVAAVRAIIGLPLATAVTHLAPPLPSARIETIVAAYKDSYHAQVVAAAGAPTPAPDTVSNTRAIGQLLYTRYVLLFQASGLILLVAMIGAIVLARRDVQAVDPGTGEAVDQGLIEKARTPLLVDQPPV